MKRWTDKQLEKAGGKRKMKSNWIKTIDGTYVNLNNALELYVWSNDLPFCKYHVVARMGIGTFFDDNAVTIAKFKTESEAKNFMEKIIKRLKEERNES